MAAKRQQKALKHQRAVSRATVKHRQQSASRERGLMSGARSERAMLKKAGGWPLHEALMTKDWRTPGEIVQIVVARTGPAGQIAAGVFLVDLGCLGVKRAFGRVLDTRYDYEAEVRDQVTDMQEMAPADLNCVAKVIEEAYYYAQDLGMTQDRDMADALLVVGDADPDACPLDVPLGGEDGKPLYIAGPYDNARAIVARLERQLGPDGFHFVAPMTGDELVDDMVWEGGEEEEDEWDEEDEGDEDMEPDLLP